MAHNGLAAASLFWCASLCLILCSFHELPDHPAKLHSLVFIPLHTTSISLFHKPIYSYPTLHQVCPVWEIHICYYPTDADVVVHTSFLIDRLLHSLTKCCVYPDDLFPLYIAASLC